MGYNKMVVYGTHLEIYEYERHLSEYQRVGRKGNRRATSAVLDFGREYMQKFRQKRKDNASRASMAFRRLVLANLTESENPVLFTLTYAENIEDVRQGYKDFHAFIQSLRNKFGSNFRYLAVPEFQKRGAVHFHSLFWGLPVDIVRTERQTRMVAGLWGKGFVYLKETDGNERLGSYLAKYMAKTFVDGRLRNQKSYVASRNIIRPLQQSGFDNVDLALRMWDIVDKEPLHQKLFGTQWLGKGRLRIYKIN